MYFRKASLLFTATAAACTLSACGGDDGNPPVNVDPGDAIMTSLAGGSFAPLGSYTDIRGKAHLARMTDGSTLVELHIEGLTPDTDYPAHVHALPCDVDNAGGHYKIDPTVTTTEEANEIWPAFRTDAAGVGRVSIAAAHAARMDAQSVVVHDPNADGAKMACADLRPTTGDTVILRGTLAPYAAAADIDAQITGTVEMTIGAQSTALAVTVEGLDPSSEYRTHLHALPCEVDNAGGHYKLDPTVEATEEANEIWPYLVPDAQGKAQDSQQHAHRVRMDAQAVVIHRVDAATGETPKVACTNLVYTENADYATRGTARLLPAATDLGYTALAAEATLTRGRDGATAAWMRAGGLTAGQTYPVHVHTYSCDLEAGGGHYKLDASVADTVEDNEIWLYLTADSAGNGEDQVAVDHLARPEAQSMVIHAAEGGERLACVDLQ